MRSKRGVSPVIASVLLILLVLVLAAIIFFWARGFIGEQIEKFGGPIENLCESLDFVVKVKDVGQYHSIEIVNRGNIGIGAFDFKVHSGGNSGLVRMETGVPSSTSLNVDVLLNEVFDSEIERVEVFPILKGKVVGSNTAGLYICEDSVELTGF